MVCFKSLKQCDVSRRNLVLLAGALKNYRSASVLACKQGLSVVRSNTSQQACHGGEKGKSRDGKSPRSFVLRIYIVGRVGVKKLHID